MNPVLTGAACAVLFFAFSAMAAAAPHPQCPLEITPASVTVKGLPGWIPYAPVPLRLHSAGMSSGPPQSLLRMRGEPLSERKNEFVTAYPLAGSGFEEGKWLDCFYGEAGEMSLSRRLDDNLKRCTITLYELVPGKPRRIRTACQ